MADVLKEIIYDSGDDELVEYLLSLDIDLSGLDVDELTTRKRQADNLITNVKLVKKKLKAKKNMVPEEKE
jgi:hypothetical protein